MSIAGSRVSLSSVNSSFQDGSSARCARRTFRHSLVRYKAYCTA
jgi:hypothetical protein